MTHENPLYVLPKSFITVMLFTNNKNGANVIYGYNPKIYVGIVKYEDLFAVEIISEILIFWMRDSLMSIGIWMMI